MDDSLEVVPFDIGLAVKVLPGVASSSRVFYSTDGAWVETPNNRQSLIVVRMDRKKQEVRVRAIRMNGWRHILERIYNWFMHRYEDIPLAIVECENGEVTDVQDPRKWSGEGTR